MTRSVIEEFARRSPRADRDSSRLAELTERELEVLKLLTRGRSNAELVVSEATVKTHVAHVLMKLGVRDRVHAMIFADECELVQPARRRPAGPPPLGLGVADFKPVRVAISRRRTIRTQLDRARDRQ